MNYTSLLDCRLSNGIIKHWEYTGNIFIDDARWELFIHHSQVKLDYQEKAMCT